MNYLATLQAQVYSMWHGFIAALPSLCIAMVIVIATGFVARSAVRIADAITGRTHLRADLQQLIETLVKLVIWIVGLMLAAAVAVPGFTPAGMIAGLGIGALAIGFAFQDTFENFLAGVFVMLRDKMQIGDDIEVEDISGKIERITLRESYIRKPTGELFVVPNAMLFKNPVLILTDADLRRDEITLGVDYNADFDATEAAIRKAFETPMEDFVTERPVGVFACEFGPSSINWLVQWWTTGDTASERRDLRTDVMKAIKRELDAAGINMPFPIVTNLFPEALPVNPLPALEGQPADIN